MKDEVGGKVAIECYKRKQNRNRQYVLYHPCRILIIGGSKSGKTNAFLNLLNHQPDIDYIYIYIHIYIIYI